jgi:hypothetical protein
MKDDVSNRQLTKINFQNLFSQRIKLLLGDTIKFSTEIILLILQINIHV